MRAAPMGAVVSAAAIIASLAACGTVPKQQPSPTSSAHPAEGDEFVSSRSVKITSPRDGRHLKGRAVIVTGRAQPENARVDLELLGPHLHHYKLHVRAHRGIWSARMRVYRSQDESIMATQPGTEDAFDMVGVKVGPPPESAYDRRVRLVARKGAIGMSATSVRHELGRPDHQQDIAGQVFWYYQVEDNLYQLVISGGVVTQINSY